MGVPGSYSRLPISNYPTQNSNAHGSFNNYAGHSTGHASSQSFTLQNGAFSNDNSTTNTQNTQQVGTNNPILGDDYWSKLEHILDSKIKRIEDKFDVAGLQNIRAHQQYIVCGGY